MIPIITIRIAVGILLPVTVGALDPRFQLWQHFSVEHSLIMYKPHLLLFIGESLFYSNHMPALSTLNHLTVCMVSVNVKHLFRIYLRASLFFILKSAHLKKSFIAVRRERARTAIH